MDNRIKVVEGIELNYHLAGFWRRAFALIIDQGVMYLFIYFYMFFIAIVGASTFFAFRKMFTKDFFNNIKETGFLLEHIIAIALGVIFFLIIPMIMAHGYFIYSEYKYGRTLGKKVMGLSVISSDGKKLSKSQCFTREFFRYIDMLLLIPGTISFLTSKKNQRLGDRFANTFIIYSKADENKYNFLYMSQEDYIRFQSLLKAKIPTDQALQAIISKTAYTLNIKKEYVPTPQIDDLVLQLKNNYNNEIKVDNKSLLIFFAELINQQEYLKEELK